MRCDKCGGNVAQGQRFCDLCGNEVTIPTPNQQPQYGQNTYGGQAQQYGQNPYVNQQPQGQNPYGGQPQYGQVPYGQHGMYNNGGSAENFNLVTAYISMWKKCFQFNGRSRRSEYWWSSLASLLVTWILYGLFFVVIILPANVDGDMSLARTASLVWQMGSIILALPGWSMMVRRLHDVGKSAWNLLWYFVPCVGVIVLLIYMAMDSQPGANQYGGNPKGL